jgi:hypothetical protein
MEDSKTQRKKRGGGIVPNNLFISYDLYNPGQNYEAVRAGTINSDIDLSGFAAL